MYEAEIESYWNQVGEFTRQHHENMRDLDRMTEEQVHDTVTDVVQHFEENFRTTYGTRLSAKIAEQKKDSTSSEIMMYIAAAVLTFFAVLIQVTAAMAKRNMKKVA